MGGIGKFLLTVKEAKLENGETKGIGNKMRGNSGNLIGTRRYLFLTANWLEPQGSH